MAYVMKASDFVNTAIKIANAPTVYYSVSGGAWCKWNGSTWNMDCVCMIKGILWGFNFNKKLAHGGAVYGSNGVYDDGADTIINRCTSVSTNFNSIEAGEIVHMAGHVGVYIGNGQVVESTAWYGKTIISNISSNGKRTKDGKSGGYWKEHGKLSYIKFDSIKPSGFSVGDKVKIGTMKGATKWIADDVQRKWFIYQIRENVNAGGENAFEWKDNGIPEGCVDLTDAKGNKRADSDRVHAKKGDYFVFAKTFTIKKITQANGKNYLYLDYDGNPSHRFWVIDSYCKKV